MLKKLAVLGLAAMTALTLLSGCMKKEEVPMPTPSPSPSPSPTVEPSPEPPMTEDTVSIIIKDEKLKAAYDAVKKEFGEFYVASPAVINEQQMQELYYVKPEDIEEFVGEMAMINVSGDTFVGVKCKPGKAADVAAALGRRRDDIIETFRTYPVNFMDIKSEACEVVTHGDYVFMILMGELNVPDGTEATMEMAQAEVERAKKCIDSVFVQK